MGFVAEGKSLMYEAWPVAEEISAANAKTVANVDGKFELVKAGRFLRSTYNIADGKKLNYHIKAADNDTLAYLNSEFDSLKLFLNAESIDITLEAFDSAANGAAPSQPCTLGIISLPLAGLIDVEAEKARIGKQLKDLDTWIKSAQGKLANERFVTSAPANVVQAARDQLAELEEKRAKALAVFETLG
jgi:valyl-tRNA synthetase